MLYFSNLHFPSKGNSPTVKSTQNKQRIRPRGCGTSLPIPCRLLALLLALAVGPMITFAEGAHEQAHAVDPTGAWLVTNTGSGGQDGVFLSVELFTNDGGWIGSAQGEGACCPILTPGFGTWERTGPNTFALTFASILYNNDGSLVATGKGQQSITMRSSDQFVGKAKFVLTAPDGTIFASGETTFVGQRVRIEPLP
jgi:hypothetical protein